MTLTKKYLDDLTYEVIDAILLSYMRMLQKPKGILINFHCTNIFKGGQRTLVNNLFALLPEG
jgi:hypothetical protein